MVDGDEFSYHLSFLNIVSKTSFVSTVHGQLTQPVVEIQ